MKIIPLSEGAFTVDKTKAFVPFDAAVNEMKERPAGSLLVEVNPYVIITSADIILIDTGLGFKINGELQIHQNLKANGIGPSEVTKVLMSHLHKDHASGIGYNDLLENFQLSFPAATYYVQQAELDYAIETGFPSFVTDQLQVLLNNPQVKMLQGDGMIDGYIKHQLTGAHSPHHQVFWIEENGEIIFFGGDVAPQLQQMRNRFIAKYDFDGRKCMELRKEWWSLGEKEKWTFLFYHDIKTPVWKFG